MLSVFNNLRSFSMLSVLVRLLLAMLCGGLIGLERELKRRPAGFRTHILICIGAAMTTLTSQYLAECLGLNTDITRLGAQVVAGVGFIGAGTIVATRQGRVRGLTTAAGLWTAAIVGLACGAGYFEGAVCVTVLILLTELVLSRLEGRMKLRRREINLCVCYDSAETMATLSEYLRTKGLRVSELELGKSTQRQAMYVLLGLRLGKRADEQQLISELRQLPGVRTVETL